MSRHSPLYLHQDWNVYTSDLLSLCFMATFRVKAGTARSVSNKGRSHSSLVPIVPHTDTSYWDTTCHSSLTVSHLTFPAQCVTHRSSAPEYNPFPLDRSVKFHHTCPFTFSVTHFYFIELTLPHRRHNFASCSYSSFLYSPISCYITELSPSQVNHCISSYIFGLFA